LRLNFNLKRWRNTRSSSHPISRETCEMMVENVKFQIQMPNETQRKLIQG
jgi:hypothetical protein